jgi:hypothetical protein
MEGASTMKRINTDHVVVDATEGGVWKCLHCGARHMPKLPMPLNEYCEGMRAFTLLHKRCKAHSGG